MAKKAKDLKPGDKVVVFGQERTVVRIVNPNRYKLVSVYIDHGGLYAKEPDEEVCTPDGHSNKCRARKKDDPIHHD